MLSSGAHFFKALAARWSAEGLTGNYDTERWAIRERYSWKHRRFVSSCTYKCKLPRGAHITHLAPLYLKPPMQNTAPLQAAHARTVSGWPVRLWRASQSRNLTRQLFPNPSRWKPFRHCENITFVLWPRMFNFFFPFSRLSYVWETTSLRSPGSLRRTQELRRLRRRKVTPRMRRGKSDPDELSKQSVTF